MLVQKVAEEANAASGTATTGAVVAQVFEDATKHLPALLVPVQKVLARALAFDCLRIGQTYVDVACLRTDLYENRLATNIARCVAMCCVSREFRYLCLKAHF